jgi:uncharacterized membrane protein (DUF2068 family)
MSGRIPSPGSRDARFPKIEHGERPQHPTLDYRPKRPYGVSIIVVLNFVVAALLVFFVFLAAGNPDLLQGGLPLVLGVAEAVVAVVVGIGLWRMARWAYVLAIGLYSLLTILALYSAFTSPFTASSLLSVVIPVAIVIYLLLPDVRAAFVAPSNPQTE